MKEFQYIEEKKSRPDSKIRHINMLNGKESKYFFRCEMFLDENEKEREFSETFHTHDFYTIYLCLNGSGMLNIDYIVYEIGPDTLFFVSPGQVHKLVSLRKNIGGFIAFSEEFMCNLSPNIRKMVKSRIFSNYGAASVCRLGHEDMVFLMDRLRVLKKYSDSVTTSMLSQNYCASVLSIVLLDILERVKMDDCKDYVYDEPKMQTYITFMDVLEKNFKRIHTADGLVDLMTISLSTLNNHLIAVTGKTASLIIVERIVKEAKTLLMDNPDMKIQLLSKELGFHDDSNFTKFFKRYTGHSPLEFRKIY